MVSREPPSLQPVEQLGWLAQIADPVKLAVVKVLASAESATVADLAESCEASVATIRRHLAALVASEIVTEEDGSSDGTKLGRPASRYRLSGPIRHSVRWLPTSR